MATCESAKHNSWANTVTLDEFSFNRHADNEKVWLPRDEGYAAREFGIVNSDKPMEVIASNSDGLCVIGVLLKGQKFNADYYCSSCLQGFRTSQAIQVWDATELIVHAKNARFHAAKSSIDCCTK
jgi:hypothetical protein